MDQAHIDSLLERYLALLDEYTRLREQLSRLQSGVYQGIARANFSAERGLRYGRDQYDDRMQASRRVEIGREEADEAEGSASFAVVDMNAVDAAAEAKETEGKTEAGTQPKDDEADTTEEDQIDGKKQGDSDKPDETEKNETEQKPTPPKHANPLRWFGILAPMPLRNAQSLSVEAVENVIPRLVTVNAAMIDVEIQVRRARKKRAKADGKGPKSEGKMAESTKASPVEAS